MNRKERRASQHLERAGRSWDRARAQHRRGEILQGQGNLEEAESHFRRAIKLRPDYAQAHIDLGNVLLHQDKLKETEASYRRAQNLAPDWSAPYNNLGYILNKRGALDEAEACLRQALELEPASALAHNNLGNTLGLQKRMEEAEASYRRALELEPDYALAHSNLGHVLLRQGHMVRRGSGDMGEAVRCYEEALKLDPQNSEARYFLDVARGKKLERSSADYISNLFDYFSEKFDQRLVNGLGYKMPEKIGATVAGFPNAEGATYSVLDLGCGTGLCGAAVHEFAAYLAGVDLSPKMIAKARERGVYDDLWVEDLDSALARFEGNLDLIIAADVFVYLGELQQVLEACSTALKRSGWLVFTTEDTDCEDYELTKTGRFAHNPHHVASLIDSSGFVAESNDVEVIRLQAGEPVHGRMFVLRRE